MILKAPRATQLADFIGLEDQLWASYVEWLSDYKRLNLLNELIRDLTNHSLKPLKKYGDLEMVICSIQRLYERLRIVRSDREIVEQLVRDANYSRYIQENTILQGKELHLLAAAHEAAKAMRGKKLILLLGDTGSGKSTLACFLLGAQLEEVESSGTRGYQLDSTPHKHMPKIGRCIGISETLHPEGYDLPPDRDAPPP